MPTVRRTNRTADRRKPPNVRHPAGARHGGSNRWIHDGPRTGFAGGCHFPKIGESISKLESVEAELDSTEERLQSVNQQVAELRRKNDTLRPILEKSQRSQKLAEEVETDIRDRQAERERINHLETEQKELKKKLKGLEENPQVLRGPQPDPQPDPQPNQPPESQPHPPSNSQPDLPKQG